MGEFKDITKPIQRLKNNLPIHAQLFIDDCIVYLSMKTVYDYCKSLNLFFNYISEVSSLAVHDIDLSIINSLTTTDIKKFQDYVPASNNSININRYKVPVSETAASRKTTPLRKYFAFLKAKGHIDNDPTLDLLPYKSSKNEYADSFIKDHEVEALIKAITEVKSTSYHSKLAAMMTVKRDIALVLLLHEAGLSSKECSLLDLTDVNLNKTIITLRKRGREVAIPINEKVTTALRDYIENEREILLRGAEDPALIISLKSNRINKETIGHMLQKYGRNIGMHEPLHSKRLYGEKKIASIKNNNKV